MDDLGRIEKKMADERRAMEARELKSAQAAAERKSQLASEIFEWEQRLGELEVRLQSYKGALAERISVFIKRKKDGDEPASLSVAISTVSPALRKPFMEFRLTASRDFDAGFSVERIGPGLLPGLVFGAKKPSVPYKSFKDILVSSEVRRLETSDHLGRMTDEEFIAVLDQCVGRLIENGGKFSYTIPDWYVNAGFKIAYAFSFVAFFFIWYACTDVNEWGFFWGMPVAWVITWLLCMAVRAAWLPLLVGFGSFAIHELLVH
jgi:hypothetical protein